MKSVTFTWNTREYRWIVRSLMGAILLAFSVNVIVGSGSFTASENHTLMQNSDGSVCAVGQNEYGELGDGTSVNQLTPVRLSEFAGVSYLSTGAYHSLALKTDGTIWAWGWNGYGQLGDNTQVTKPTPNQVPTFTGGIAVAASQSHSLSAKS